MVKQQFPNKGKRTKIKKKGETVVEKYFRNRDLPEWFRGLSQFQMDAGSSLQNCIRDDSEQGTSHRVRDALIKIGISPLVSSAKIKLAMRLSRGNDMAFLWFLMELYYRNICNDCEHKIDFGYTVNEQIIMTLIAHLDTITTLRELDKLLPKQPLQPKIRKPPKKKKVKQNYVLPYFEKQPRPVPYGKSLSLNELDNAVNLCEYSNYLNPNYVVPNEGNRWFANYKLNESERIATRIVKDQIKDVVAQEEAGVLKDDRQNPIYCAHDEAMAALKQKMAYELQVAKKKACEKYFDLDGQLKDQSYKRVIEKLDEEIAKAEEYLNKFGTGKLKKAPSKLDQELDKQKSEIEGRERASSNTIVSNQNCYDEYFNKYDFGHAGNSVNKSKFFEAPSCHKPYKFNYNKIFDLGPKNPIKDVISTALQGGSSCDMSADHSQTVRNCCKEIWANEVQKHNAESKQKRRDLKKKPPPPEKVGLGFDLPYYDPSDDKLMASMLNAAMQEMRKNKKFVFASLPNAHKAPTLKEFIKNRYGKVYKRIEKRKSFKLSKKVFHVLRKDEIRIKIPQLDDLAKERVVSYGCKDYLFSKTNYLKDRYHHNFKISLLDTARAFWAIVRPYECSKGPPRNVVFAYLPARENDIYMFRPWQGSEYMHAKDEWKRRLAKRETALLY